MGTFSVWHWLIVLVIVVLVFGTKKLKNLGGDLGSAVKGFKDGMKDGGADANVEKTAVEDQSKSDKTTIDVDAKQKS